MINSIVAENQTENKSGQSKIRVGTRKWSTIQSKNMGGRGTRYSLVIRRSQLIWFLKFYLVMTTMISDTKFIKQIIPYPDFQDN